MADPRVQTFRKELNKWKKEHFFQGLVNEANSESENRRIDEARRMFKVLMEKIKEMEQQIQSKKEEQEGGDQAVDELLSILGPEERWTETLLNQVRSILITDLLEYPLTFNSSLIDQFKQEPNFPTYH